MKPLDSLIFATFAGAAFAGLNLALFHLVTRALDAVRPF